ncbi:MAG TPA: hypothetical protein VFE51_02095 [Verrucomicrobiae bacterium]|nr:hypothetical protein [Verrucomicrobiae bacterium]
MSDLQNYQTNPGPVKPAASFRGPGCKLQVAGYKLQDALVMRWNRNHQPHRQALLGGVACPLLGEI